MIKRENGTREQMELSYDNAFRFGNGPPLSFIMSMNKSEIKVEAEEFLREARELIEQGLVFFVPREANRLWMRELDMVTDQVWAVLKRLTANNYCAGPEEDRDREATFLWKFGCTLEKQETYIKLKI